MLAARRKGPGVNIAHPLKGVRKGDLGTPFFDFKMSRQPPSPG